MKENLEILATWWADQVCSPKMNWDNGDNSESGGIAFLLANLLAQNSREEIADDAPEKFKTLFVEKAMAHQAEHGRLPEMSVDYHPSPFLSEIAQAAGISENAFPCKSYSVIRDGKPLAACGYGKPLVDLTEAATA